MVIHGIKVILPITRVSFFFIIFQCANEQGTGTCVIIYSYIRVYFMHFFVYFHTLLILQFTVSNTMGVVWRSGTVHRFGVSEFTIDIKMVKVFCELSIVSFLMHAKGVISFIEL